MSGYLEVTDMHQNNLSGVLPNTFSVVSSLRSFNLHGNELEGKIPWSLANCKELQDLDLGDNHLIDTFPMWLGTLPKLQVLSLRSNKLYGPIITSRNEIIFAELRIIDLSCNDFSGNLPTNYHSSVTIANKGQELELVRILTIYTSIDLSSNKFEGPIPSIMGDLIALQLLNLSHNRLQSQIPPSLGSLSLVESLDLSGNHLVGEMLAQLSSLASLEVLNLSYNHLKGCIPQGPQFQTFESNSYEGNDGLCGFPISKVCGKNCVSETNYTVSALDHQESNSECLNDFWKAALMGYRSGLCIGLSIVYFTISTRNLR
ncbi:receptor-like protein 9DC3 [Lycium barbarum]|uniref:receptor-like protein 9DC3 n=1 Tax=Lycium barbarum TaxID=112863 RepID=UPI00293E6F40|nr:receptor-like protein 9DC3 [Lycium barbarum]